jgi:hypothetical protein
MRSRSVWRLRFLTPYRICRLRAELEKSQLVFFLVCDIENSFYVLSIFVVIMVLVCGWGTKLVLIVLSWIRSKLLLFYQIFIVILFLCHAFLFVSLGSMPIRTIKLFLQSIMDILTHTCWLLRRDVVRVHSIMCSQPPIKSRIGHQ